MFLAGGAEDPGASPAGLILAASSPVRLGLGLHDRQAGVVGGELVEGARAILAVTTTSSPVTFVS